MQNLLEAIVATRSDTAIIDITGVPTVDTLVAQHLLKTVVAARLMGADCIISGIRPRSLRPSFPWGGPFRGHYQGDYGRCLLCRLRKSGPVGCPE